MKHTITEAEKKEIRGALTYELEYIWGMYGDTGYDLRRAFDEGYGIVKGFLAGLRLQYTDEAIRNDGMFGEIDDIWRVYCDRYFEARREAVNNGKL